MSDLLKNDRAISGDSPLDACGLTDIGRKRSDNQDQFLIAELRKSMFIRASSLASHGPSQVYGGSYGQLLAVADGMGGHAAGRRASLVAMQELISDLLNRVHWRLQSNEDADEDFVDSLKELLQHAHMKVLAEAAAHISWHGMGTTLTIAHILWPRLYVVHAGDSRCYLIRGGKCKQLTTDHTLAHQLVQSGGLRPEDESSSRWSNVLWNVLGGSGEQELLAEVSRIDLQTGDVVLLCSDGLTRYLSPEIIADVIRQTGNELSVACHRLVDLANQAGGEDNITVVLSRPTAAIHGSQNLDESDLSAGAPSQFKTDSGTDDASFIDEETWPE